MVAHPHIRPEGDERWIYILRRHWIALALRGSVPFVLGLVTGGLVLERSLNREPDFLGRQPPLLDSLGALLLLLAFAMAAVLLYIYYDWRNDFLIVSNKRVIHEDRTLFLSFRYETIPLERVQNVNIRSIGLQKLLGYGRIEVQAGGPSNPIVFERARDPGAAQSQIMREMSREKREQEQRRLQATIQKRINPNAPALLTPRVPIEQDIATDTTGISSWLPFRPVLANGAITWRRHWIVLLAQLIGPIVAALIWVGLLVFLPQLALLSTTQTTLLLFLGLVFVIAYFGYQIDDWRNDIYVLDATRAIDVSRKPLGLYEERVEASLGAIQNVNASAPNLVAKLFNYGDVLIETAGSAGNLTFYTVANPERVQRIIFEYIDRYKWNQREREWHNALTIVEQYDQFKSPPLQP